MKVRRYKAVVRHDMGRCTFVVTSLSGGRRSAIAQIMAAEGCPECAIVKLNLIKNKVHKN